MGDVKLVTSLVFIALFSIALVAYVTNWGLDNGAVVNLENDTEFSDYYTNQTGGITTFQVDTNSSSTSFSQSEISEGDQTTRTGGQFKVGMGAMITSIKNTAELIQQKLFGGSVAFGVIITGFIALLVYMAFRFVWQTWRGGSAE